MTAFSATERMTLTGTVTPSSFQPWILRHAARLGLQGAITHADDGRIELEISGPPDLLDAMEMGCSLGPIDVWVETIERSVITPSGR